jgi:hypothetical protein
MIFSPRQLPSNAIACKHSNHPSAAVCSPLFMRPQAMSAAMVNVLIIIRARCRASRIVFRDPGVIRADNWTNCGPEKDDVTYDGSGHLACTAPPLRVTMVLTRWRARAATVRWWWKGIVGALLTVGWPSWRDLAIVDCMFYDKLALTYPTT